MSQRIEQLLALRREAQQIHGYNTSSPWYIYLNRAIACLALAETANGPIDQFRNAWLVIQNISAMGQAGEQENRALSDWIKAITDNPVLQAKAQQFPTTLLEAIQAAQQEILWDSEQRRWREAKTPVEAWLQVRTRGREAPPGSVCAWALLIGRDLRNAANHPGLDPSRPRNIKVFKLAAPLFVELAEAAIRTTIEHPEPATTGRAIAYRFFLFPYAKNSDSFLSDYYLERLLPEQELTGFDEAQSKTLLRNIKNEWGTRNSQLLPANDAEPTVAGWCQPVLFPALGLAPQAGVKIVTDEAVYEPTFVLSSAGAEIRSEYSGKSAARDLACLLWVLPWRAGLDSTTGDNALAGLSVMEVAQQALLQSDVEWAILTNGRCLRLLNKTSAHRPRAYLEVDLEPIVTSWTDPRARQAFRYLLCFFSESSLLSQDAQGRTRLNRIVAESERHGKEIGEELKQNVFKALEELGEGFLYLMRQDHARVQRWQAKIGNKEPVGAYLMSDGLFKLIYEEALALMYRLLFLFYAESRDLLPMHNDLYRDSYSLEAVRDDIISVHDDPDRAHRFFSKGAADLDARLRELFALVNEGGLGGLIPAYNGGLFDPEKHRFLEDFGVGDFYLARAIDLLSRTRPRVGSTGGEGRKKVTYRDLDVRHLGEIYEGLLEYSAHIAPEEQVIFERTQGGSKYEEYVAASKLSASERKQLADYRQATEENSEFPNIPQSCKVRGIKEKGDYYLIFGGRESKRRSTGSYYTPDYIVQYIVENTLGPLVRGENREGDLKDKALTSDEILGLKVLDPAMGSGHFLVAATEYLARAYGQALIREGKDTDGMMSDGEFIRYKRMVAGRCIYGVDINPMAVELTKLSMWLFTMDRERPLSFLDHHLKCGNSLVGAWIRELGTRLDAGTNPLQLNLFEQHFLAQVPTMVNNVLAIAERETLTPQDVRDKKALDEAIEDIKLPYRNIAHLWTGALFGEPATDYESYLTNPESARHLVLAGAEKFAFFHWELEFPELWFDKHGNRHAEGGFDCVVGNPPYVRTHNMDVGVKGYLLERSRVYIGKSDIYYAFIEQAGKLTGDKKLISFITKDSWLYLAYAEPLRKLILKSLPPHRILHFGYEVFDEAAVTTTVFILVNAGHQATALVGKTERRVPLDDVAFTAIPLQYFAALPFSVVDLTLSDVDRGIKSAMLNSGVKLGDVCEVQFGMKTGDDALWLSDDPGGANPKPLYTGEDVQRNEIRTNRLFVDYLPQQMTSHRRTARPGEAKRFERPKILVKDTAGGLACAVDEDGLYVKDVLLIYPQPGFSINLPALAAVLNSSSMRFFYETTYPSLHVQNDELKNLPIPAELCRVQDEAAERSVHELAELQRKVSSSPRRRARFSPADLARIDHLVCELYDMTYEQAKRLSEWGQ